MRKITAVLTIGICLTVLIIAGFPGLGDATTIYGCYGKLAGVMRIMSGPGQCSRFENPISWNQTGPQGETGPQGVQGPQGVPGALSLRILTRIINFPPHSYVSEQFACEEGEIPLNAGMVSDEARVYVHETQKHVFLRGYYVNDAPFIEIQWLNETDTGVNGVEVFGICASANVIWVP